ncbi:MAG: hypothetical protein LUQ25_09055 [Methanoregulaceae archaeon]|nr:hypothetical protein [Methanoregulaceae archaeon]
MDDRIPSCSADAVRKIRRIDVAGCAVGISNLDDILASVRELGLSDPVQVQRELIARVKVYNYVPPPAEEAYSVALMKEYSGLFS